MDSLQDALDKITVEKKDEGKMDSDYPVTYNTNSEKELYMLSCCENFQRQYSHLYRDRKPLFLCPKNECGIEKFICTTLRPTLLKFPELNNYDGCSEFVADYLNFEPLDSPIDLPLVLSSPTTVLKKQGGNCFDYCNLLCSLLIGSGYDAYCVCGYASREVTLMDETREECPLLKKTDKVEESENKTNENKYLVKPPKDLKSKFEEMMAEKKRKEAEDAERKLRDEEEEKRLEREKPPADKLRGLRVHCWVLVLAGKREVPESFFIEALTGQPKPLDFSGYYGIESVWNHRNVWVNMQDCSEGVKKLSYDMGDVLKWEYMFPNTDKPLLKIPDVSDDLLEIDEEKEDDIEENGVDIPPSWVKKIEVSPKDFKTRCPDGKSTKFYKNTKVEKFCEYLNSDGLVTRISIASDNELKNITEIQENYKNRDDKLERKVLNKVTGWITEYYLPGRVQSLKEHSYKEETPGAESERTMTFYAGARIDGLSKREETALSLTEYYENRPDFLSYRHATFKERVKKFGPQGSGNHRVITKMVEKFMRNPKKDAASDIAERTFYISDDRMSEDRICIKYHLEDGKITASTRDFIKPSNTSADKSTQINYSSDMTTAFQVDPYEKPPKELDIYNMMVDLLDAEGKCIEKIRISEEEVRTILVERLNEEANTELMISVYDTERNEKAKLRREDLERQQKEEELRKRDMELDYLAPFLARIGNPPSDELTRKDAEQVKVECLNDLKQRLIDKANLIQGRFEKETSDLQEKQAWYQENQMNMTKEDEEDYLNFCSEAMFRIHILEQRLNRHKEMATQKYMQLDEKLRKDPRFADLFF